MRTIKASVIIPAFNAENTIIRALNCLLNQSISKQELEILVINDGSTDSTGEVCNQFKNKNKDLILKIINQQNSGVSASRNKGMNIAKGQYLFFLDADDEISSNTIQDVVDFFEAYDDQIDIVTYTQIYKGLKKGVHYRYKKLNETGIYDIEKTRSISLSNPNYCVKKSECIRFNEHLKFHEDELFAADVVMRKKRLGYVKSAEYIYYFTASNTVNSRANPIYIHDDSIKMYESLCETYKTSQNHVSGYIQDLIINDFSWKLKTNNLWPVHLRGEEKQKEIDRIIRILNKIDNTTILNHENVDKFHKHYFLSIKTENRPYVKYDNKRNRIVLKDKNGLDEHCKGNEIFLTRIINRGNGKIQFLGFLKNYILNYTNKLRFYYTTSTLSKINEKRQIAISRTSIHSYYKCKTQTSNFPFFSITINAKYDKEINFYIEYEGHFWPVTAIYNFRTSPLFETNTKSNIVGDSVVKISKTGIIVEDSPGDVELFRRARNKQTYKDSKVKYLLRLLCEKKKIWLYVDRSGVFDNAYYQFKSDLNRRDGVRRYYIYDDDLKNVKEKFSKHEQKYLVQFKSIKHIILFLRSSKVFTSFVDEEFYLPMKISTYNKYYRDKNKVEIVYLQHGVLNAKTIHYSNELVWVDKITVSTNKEKENLENYGYDKQDLYLTGMSRFDSYCQNSGNKNKILWIPSWRRYLIGAFNTDTNRWEKKDINKISNEDYFMAIKNVTTNQKLSSHLEKLNYKLDIKLHPIVLPYLQDLCFRDTKQISFIKDIYDPSEYKLIVTDFSSYVFDFVYLNKKIVIFVPDEAKLQAGLSLYNDFFINPNSLSNQYFNLYSDLIDYICECLKQNNFTNEVDKTNLFCFDRHKKCCDSIYNEAIKTQ